MVHSVFVDASPKQLSKLRNGHSVRIKPNMEGKGIRLNLDPSRLTKSFRKGKAITLALSPQEIADQREIVGEGIFGPKVDRYLSRKGLKKAAYRIGDQLKTPAKAGIVAGLTSGATALGVSNPALIPYLPMAVGGLSNLAFDFLDNPDDYYSSNVGGSRAKGKARDLAGRVAQQAVLDRINSTYGTNMGNLDSASIGNAIANKASADIANMAGKGLYAGGEGRGLYSGGQMVGGERGVRLMGGSVGLNAGFVGRQQPQALQSQPFGANFQFRNTLPPAFQKFIV